MRGRTSRQQWLIQIINLIYEVEDRDEMLAALFAKLRDLLPFSSGVLLPIDPCLLELQGAVCFDCPPENTTAYLEHYAAFDPYVRRDPGEIILNQTARLSDVARNRELDESEFSDFLVKVPYRQALAAVVGFNGQPLAAFSVHRLKDQVDFSRDEMAVLDCIAPHLGRALALRRWRTDPAQVDRVGLLAFGASGQLLFRNAPARRFVAPEQAAAVLAALPPAGSGSLRVGAQRYRASRVPWRAASLLTGFALEDSDTTVPRNGSSGGGGAENWVATKRRGAKLTIVTLVPFRPRDDIRGRLDHHGLSPRELEITAQSLLTGLGNAQLADRFCISEDTVKSHLRKAYRKIGVGSRMELLVHLLGLEGDLPLGSHAVGPDRNGA